MLSLKKITFRNAGCPSLAQNRTYLIILSRTFSGIIGINLNLVIQTRSQGKIGFWLRDLLRKVKAKQTMEARFSIVSYEKWVYRFVVCLLFLVCSVVQEAVYMIVPCWVQHVLSFNLVDGVSSHCIYMKKAKFNLNIGFKLSTLAIKSQHWL